MAQFTAPSGASGINALKQLITNRSNPARPDTHFDIGVPVALTGDSTYNSRVLVKPTILAKLSGQMYFRFNRVPLNKMLDVSGSKVTIDGITKVSGLLAKLSAASNLSITMDDLVEADIPAGSVATTLTAASTSRFFIPGTTLGIGQSNTDGPAWFLLNADTLTDRMGSTPTVTPGSSTVDSTFKIDNRSSRVVPVNSAVVIALPTPFDMTLPEWTIEWSQRYNNGLANYANLFILSTNGAEPGFTQRQSNSGFGNRIQQGVITSTVASLYGLPFNTVGKNGQLVRYAAVKFNNVITLFIDGVPTLLANGTGGTYDQRGIPTTSSSPPSTTNRLTIGGQGVGFNMGSVRISKFARYFTQYTPADI